ncbi:hypothetical protein [Azospirillum sp.]|uniref:hypothetical protein n=1 Tax=Azospirillum sp. TaxID=34012 RepID=UPI003D719E8E
MPNTAITFSCDTNYFPLLKGLVLSLADLGLPNDEITLYLADTGCSEADLRWLASHGVKAVPFDYRDHFRFPASTPDSRRYASLLYRPVIPTLFPGHEVYVHIDADIWIQNASGLMNYITICARHPDKVVVTPCVDFSYMSEYRKQDANIKAMFRMYTSVYDETVAAEYYGRPVLSAGMFAVHRDHPFWAAWKQEMDRSYGKSYIHEVDRGGSDQTTMNYLLHRDLNFIPLSAAHNYNCHVGFPQRRLPEGKVTVGFPPYDAIDVVHLTCFSTYNTMYHKYGLLYDSGRYLSEEDRRTLRLA